MCSVWRVTRDHGRNLEASLSTSFASEGESPHNTFCKLNGGLISTAMYSSALDNPKQQVKDMMLRFIVQGEMPNSMGSVWGIHNGLR